MHDIFKHLINFIIILNSATINRCSDEFLTNEISCWDGSRPGHNNDRKRGDQMAHLYTCTLAETVLFRSSIWINYPNYKQKLNDKYRAYTFIWVNTFALEDLYNVSAVGFLMLIVENNCPCGRCFKLEWRDH